MSSRIEELTPDTQEKVLALLAQAKGEGLPIEVIHTLRTLQEQALLYAKGRWRPGVPCDHDNRTWAIGTCKLHPWGRTVTRARPGYSWHNFARAADVAFVGQDGMPSFAKTWPWHRLGEIGETAGLGWGGRFPGGDFDHFELPKGTLADARRAAGLLL